MRDDTLVFLSPGPEPPGKAALEAGCADDACALPLDPHDERPLAGRHWTRAS